jgi:hypothetical protein
MTSIQRRNRRMADRRDRHRELLVRLPGTPVTGLGFGPQICSACPWPSAPLIAVRLPEVARHPPFGVARGCQTPTLSHPLVGCQTPTGVARHPPFGVARGLPDIHPFPPFGGLPDTHRGCQTPTVWGCQTPTLSHPLARGCQTPTVWGCQTPTLSQPLAKGVLIAANQSEFGLGVWDPLGVWVSGTPLGVWVSGTPNTRQRFRSHPPCWHPLLCQHGTLPD